MMACHELVEVSHVINGFHDTHSVFSTRSIVEANKLAHRTIVIINTCDHVRVNTSEAVAADQGSLKDFVLAKTELLKLRRR